MQLLYLLLFITHIHGMDEKIFLGLLKDRNLDTNICTLALVRPKWLLGSLDYCQIDLKQNLYQPSVYKSKDLIDYILLVNNEVTKMKNLILPQNQTDLIHMNIIIIEIEHHEFYKMIKFFSLQYVDYNTAKKCNLHTLTFFSNSVVNMKHIIPQDPKCNIDPFGIEDKSILCTERSNSELSAHNGPLFCYFENDPLPKLIGVQINGKVIGENSWIVLDEINRIDDYLIKYVENIGDDIFKYNYIGFLSSKENVCPVVLIDENWFIGSKKNCKISTDNCKVPTETMSKSKVVIFNRKRDEKEVRRVLKFIYLNEYDFSIDKDIYLVKVNTILINNMNYMVVKIPPCVPIDQSYVHWTHCQKPKKYVSCYNIFGTLVGFKKPVFLSNYVYTQKICQRNNSSKYKCGVTSEKFDERPSGIIMCRKYTNEYELVGFETDNINQELFIESLVDKTAILKYSMQEQKSLKKFPIIAKLTNETHRCLAALIDKDWLIGSMKDCFFEPLFSNLGKDNSWQKWTVIITEQKIKIDKIVFSENNDVSENRIILIKLKQSYPIQIDPVLPKNIPCDTYVSVTVNDKKPIFEIVYNEELPEACFKKPHRWTLDNRFICTKFGRKQRKIGKLLFSETIQDYQLIAIPLNLTKYNLIQWFSIIPYQNWITKVMNNNYDPLYKVEDFSHSKTWSSHVEYKHKNTKGDYRDTRKLEREEIKTVLYMVKIFVDIFNECYGYLISRNWVISNNNCKFGPMTRKYDSNKLVPLKSITYAKVQTKNLDIYLISHMMYPTLKDVDENAQLNDTFLFLKLLWPIVLNRNTEIISVGQKPVALGTTCAIISDIPSTNDDINIDVFRKTKTHIVKNEICKASYLNVDIPWDHIYCTSPMKETLYPNSILICNFRLTSISINRWNIEPHAYRNFEKPIGWIRLDAFNEQIRIAEDSMIELKHTKYGRIAEFWKWKFLASVQYKQYHLFTASLISKNFLLTSSAYSADEINNSILDLQVVFKIFDLHNHTKNLVYRIKEAKTIKGKIPLIIIRLLTPVQNIPIITIPSQTKFSQLNCIAAGWPRDSIIRWYHYESFQRHNYLREESFITHTITLSTFKAISINKFCLADYGVPLVCNNQLIGINNYDDSCKLSEWLNIPKYLEHIEHALTRPQAENWEKYLVLVLIDDIYTCIGTLIHSRWILTSSMCVLNARPEQITVVLGLPSLDELEHSEKHEIIKYKISDNKTNPNASLALLLLKHAIPLHTSKFSLVDIINPNMRNCSTFVDPENITAGWPDDKKRSTHIQINRLYSKPLHSCENNFPKNTKLSKDNLLCMVIFESRKKITHLNYPGGPLICSDPNSSYRIQYAVNTWGMSHKDGVSSVLFTKIFNHFGWIEHNLRHTPVDRSQMSNRRNVIEYYEERIIHESGNRNTLCFYVFFIVINLIYFY